MIETEFTLPKFICELNKKDKSGKTLSLYKCMVPGCGREFECLVSRINNKKYPVKSCGCYQKIVASRFGKANKKHGKAKSCEYNIWCTMKARCDNPNHWEYNAYGGAGIKYCETWKNFEGFYEDMGDRPSKEYSIDRIDNSKGYYKENCKWSTAKEQARNRKSSRLITFRGYTATVAEWSERTGLSRNVIESRIDHYGFSIEDALITPKMKNQFTKITERIKINLPEIENSNV